MLFQMFIGGVDTLIGWCRVPFQHSHLSGRGHPWSDRRHTSCITDSQWLSSCLTLWCNPFSSQKRTTAMSELQATGTEPTGSLPSSSMSNTSAMTSLHRAWGKFAPEHFRKCPSKFVFPSISLEY